MNTGLSFTALSPLLSVISRAYTGCSPQPDHVAHRSLLSLCPSLGVSGETSTLRRWGLSRIAALLHVDPVGDKKPPATQHLLPRCQHLELHLRIDQVAVAVFTDLEFDPVDLARELTGYQPAPSSSSFPLPSPFPSTRTLHSVPALPWAPKH